MILLALCAATVQANQTVTYSTQPTPDNSTPASATVGQFYTYDADASASDGSPVRYSLSYGPSGMSVNETTGEVSWFVTVTGNYSAGIRAEMVNDPAQSAVQEWNILASSPTGTVVSTNPLSFSSICINDDITVAYTASGGFVPGNAFILQLSDPNGSFQDGFLNIGSVSSTVSGTITAKFPATVVPGDHYRVRVISSNPVMAGNDNGSDLQIKALPYVAFDRVDPSRTEVRPERIIQGGTIEFPNHSDSGIAYAWDFGDGAVPATSTLRDPGPVTYTTGGNKKVSLTVTGLNGCSATLAAIVVEVMPTTVQVPSKADIIQGEGTVSGGGRTIWVCPGGTFLSGGGGSHTVYVESGGSVVLGGGGSYTMYLKSGASITGDSGGGGHVIIYEQGANPGTRYERHLVPSMTFDYTNAPVGGCPSLAPYTKRIPDDVLSISGTQSIGQTDKEIWVRSGAELEASGNGNTYIADPGSRIIAMGNNATVYLKNGASFEARGGGGHRIFHEVNATIVNAGTNSGLFPSSGITYLYQGNVVSSVRNEGASDADNRITVSPNPASSSVMIRNNSHSRTVRAISLHDVLGATLTEMDVTLHEGTSFALPLDGIAPGTYYIRLHGDGEIIVKKLMVR